MTNIKNIMKNIKTVFSDNRGEILLHAMIAIPTIIMCAGCVLTYAGMFDSKEEKATIATQQATIQEKIDQFQDNIQVMYDMNDEDVERLTYYIKVYNEKNQGHGVPMFRISEFVTLSDGTMLDRTSGIEYECDVIKIEGTFSDKTVYDYDAIGEHEYTEAVKAAYDFFDLVYESDIEGMDAFLSEMAVN